ncbi:hypothetical protein SRHO_G00220400 [Serrasalmus rhombeus]
MADLVAVGRYLCFDIPFLPPYHHQFGPSSGPGSHFTLLKISLIASLQLASLHFSQQQSIRNLKPRPALLTQPTLLLLNTPDLQGQIRQLNAWPASPPEPAGVQPKVLDH